MNKLPLVRCGCSAAVLLVSIAVAVAFWKTRPKTTTQPPREPELSVHLQTAARTNRVVRVESHGRVQTLRRVQLAARVAGEVLETAPELRPGLRVEKGQLLVKIDPVDSEIVLAEARSAVSRLESHRRMIEITQDSEREQLKLARRSLELTETDFERVKSLSEQGQAVSVSVVEAAERSVTQARTQVLQLEQSLTLVPSRLEEVESELRAARSRVEQAEIQLARTEITAPFDGRVLNASVEKGEYLQPGGPVVELADDSVLEIHVPVPASDLRNWLPFKTRPSEQSGWFPPLEPVEVTIEWSEASADHQWRGTLHRITDFDTTTRTAMVVVRVVDAQTDGGFPLTEGMFCKVRIPGRELKDVIALPREAVTFEGHCYISENGRLKTVEVEVARSEGGQVYVSRGLSEGDQVIVTRLVAPLEGAKLVEAGK